MLLIDALHAGVEACLWLALWPASHLPPGLQWVWAAALSGAVLMAIWHRLQSPRRLQLAWSAAWAQLLGVWLFRQDPGAAAKAQLRALAANSRLLLRVLWPAVATLFLTAPVLVQLHGLYGHEPWLPQADMTMHLQFANPGTMQHARLEWVGDGGVVDVVVREPARASATARLRALRRGQHAVRITAGEHMIEIPVSVSEPPVVVRLGVDAGDRFWYGGLPIEGPLQQVRLAYTPASWRSLLLFGAVSCLGAAVGAMLMSMIRRLPTTVSMLVQRRA